MPTRNVVITEHQADLIERLVAAGRYQNASEVLRDGLRLVEQREDEDRARLKALRAAARVGIADVEAGRFYRFETAAELGAFLKVVTDEAIAEGLARRATALAQPSPSRTGARAPSPASGRRERGSTDPLPLAGEGARAKRGRVRVSRRRS